MADRDEALEEQARQLQRFKDVFRASWQETVGRRWPDLEGDVEALCAQAYALGVADGQSRGRAVQSARLVAERNAPFDAPA